MACSHKSICSSFAHLLLRKSHNNFLFGSFISSAFITCTLESICGNLSNILTRYSPSIFLHNKIPKYVQLNIFVNDKICLAHLVSPTKLLKYLIAQYHQRSVCWTVAISNQHFSMSFDSSMYLLIADCLSLVKTLSRISMARPLVVVILIYLGEFSF